MPATLLMYVPECGLDDFDHLPQIRNTLFDEEVWEAGLKRVTRLRSDCCMSASQRPLKSSQVLPVT